MMLWSFADAGDTEGVRSLKNEQIYALHELRYRKRRGSEILQSVCDPAQPHVPEVRSSERT
jgi:hypothetical protein